MGNAWRLGKRLVRGGPARRQLARKLAESAPLPEANYEIGVYFADGAVNLYQLRQWYKPLLELSSSRPVLILSRSAPTALKLLEESPLPVAYVRRVTDLEQVI